MVEMILLSIAMGTSNLCVSATNKIKKLGNVLSGKSLASDIMNKSKKNCLIIERIVNPVAEKINYIKCLKNKEYRFFDYYHVLNKNNNIKYRAKYQLFTFYRDFFKNSKIIELYDNNNVKKGYIEIRPFRNHSKDIRMCYIYVDDKKVISLKKYKTSSNIYASLEDGDFEINYNKLNAYNYKCKNKSIGKLHITLPKEESNYMEKYVVEYENKEDEILEVLISIGIDILNTL